MTIFQENSLHLIVGSSAEIYQRWTEFRMSSRFYRSAGFSVESFGRLGVCDRLARVCVCVCVCVCVKVIVVFKYTSEREMRHDERNNSFAPCDRSC